MGCRYASNAGEVDYDSCMTDCEAGECNAMNSGCGNDDDDDDAATLNAVASFKAHVMMASDHTQTSCESYCGHTCGSGDTCYDDCVDSCSSGDCNAEDSCCGQDSCAKDGIVPCEQMCSYTCDDDDEATCLSDCESGACNANGLAATSNTARNGRNVKQEMCLQYARCTTHV